MSKADAKKPVTRPSRVKVTRDVHTGDKVYMIDAHSKTIGQDLLSVFRRNVRAAREENKKLFGTADGRPSGR
ncbi:MAG: hypothetical protein IT548_03670 [Alphaproteobacteria bacterium]|nr:hypothetical protein [Alphaproteobacteria bacterium]